LHISFFITIQNHLVTLTNFHKYYLIIGKVFFGGCMSHQKHVDQNLNDAATALLEDDLFYEKHATPLKSATYLKHEHFEFIKEQLALKDFSDKIQLAFEAIVKYLPERVSSLEWNQIKEQFLHAKEHMHHWDGDSKAICFQKIMGFSDSTLHDIYSVACQLIDNTDYQEALALFTLLTFLKGNCPQFWMGLAICLYHQSHFEEALEALKIVKILDRENLPCWIYSTLCHLQTNVKIAHEDYHHVETLMKQADHPREWAEILTYINQQLK
jgi:tetratricopeptide (TPR) repeat protein